MVQAVGSTNPSTPLATDGTDKDSKEKLKALDPMITKAAEKYGIPKEELQALVLQESRGYSADEMQAFTKTAGFGLTGLGQNEFNTLRDGGTLGAPGHTFEVKPHPELQGLDWSTSEGQIMGAAALLSEDHNVSGEGGNSWTHALTGYNGGDPMGDHLNDSAYLKNHQMFLDAIRAGGAIPS